MVLRYLESARLLDGHTSGITALSFSAEGTYLASAGLDGKACIWDPSDNRLLHVFSGSVPVVSLTWAYPREDVLVCGLQDGTVVCLIISQLDLVVAGFWAHSYPVECLRVMGDLLASGAHEEVQVWRGVGAELSEEAEIPSPPISSFNRLAEIVVTSLHWVGADSLKPVRLVVTYLNHGVHVYDTTTWDHICSIPIPGQIADASISPDAKRIAISNVIAGFDVYSLELGQAVCSFGHTVSGFRKVPVLFVHDGLALLGGNLKGDVHLWDVQSGRKLHSLIHKKDEEIMTLAAYYHPAFDCFMIATGVLNGASQSAIYLWKAEELGRSEPPERAQGHRQCRVPWVAYWLLPALVVAVSAVMAREFL